jgi:ankyrin repeat protein
MTINGDIEGMTLLLDKGEDPNVHGGSFAIPRMYSDMVIAVVEYGTALCAASQSGSLKAVRLLLERGADPNAQGMGFVILGM